MIKTSKKTKTEVPKAKRRTASADEIAEAVSAKLKRDAYWAEVDAYRFTVVFSYDHGEVRKR